MARNGAFKHKYLKKSAYKNNNGSTFLCDQQPVLDKIRKEKDRYVFNATQIWINNNKCVYRWSYSWSPDDKTVAELL